MNRTATVTNTWRGTKSVHVVMAAIALAVLAGCQTPAATSDDGESSGPPAVEAHASSVAVGSDLDVGIEYPRYLQTRRRVEVTVANTGDRPVTIKRLELDAAQFSSLPPVAKDADIGPGRRVDLQSDFGAAVCDVDEDGPASAILRIDADGTTRDVAFPLPVDVLSDIHDDECGQLAVMEAVDLRLSGQSTDRGDGLQTDLVIRRAGSREPVSVTNIRGSVIFTVTPVDGAEAPLVELTSGQEVARLPVLIKASRCDPHAVAESKKTYLFPVWVQVGDTTAQFVTVDAEPSMRERLDRLIDECMARAG